MKAEVTRLIYSATGTANYTHYIDLFRGMCLVNGRNMGQFKNGKPLMVMGSIRLSSSAEEVEAIKPTWASKNAFNKANDAWTRTLQSAGLKKSQLNTYGKELRVAWDNKHDFCEANSADSIVDAIPDGVDSYYKTGQYDAAGLEYFVYAELAVGSGATDPTWGPSPSGSPTSYNVRAFDQTTAAVPLSGAVDVKDKLFCVFGDHTDASGAHLPILDTYLDSRINEARVEDTDMDGQPVDDNDFIMMLAPGEEVADDVIENVKDEGRWRPYTTLSSKSSHKIVTAGANVAGQDTSFHAPLGLLKWVPAAATSKLVIDIIAVTEM